MLCFGAHHSRQKPPQREANILPIFWSIKSLLWLIECPIHPTTAWVNPKHNMLRIPIEVKHPVKKVVVRSTINSASISQRGLYRCWTFSKIFMYCWESAEGFPWETIGNDFNIFYAWSEWRDLSYYFIFTWNIRWNLFFQLSCFIWKVCLRGAYRHRQLHHTMSHCKRR